MSTSQVSAPAGQDDILEVVMRPFRKPSSRFRLAVWILTGVVLVGVAAWIYQVVVGMAVSGYTDRSFWSVYIADVIAVIGVSYGGAVVSAILLLTGASWRAPLVRMAEGTALVTVIVGSLFILPHAGRPERILHMVTSANPSSPVFWDMMAIITYTFGTVVFFILPLIPDTATLLETHGDELGRGRRFLFRILSKGWVGSPEQRRVLHSAMVTVAIAIIPLAVSVHSVLGWAFALVGRPGWHESIWAPYFVIAALYSGVALVILVAAGFRRGYHLESYIATEHFVRLGYIMVAFGAVYAYLTFSDLLPSGYVGGAGHSNVIYGMLLGDVAAWFWFFVAAGAVIPILLIALPRTRNTTGVVIAAALVVVAMWAKRMVMVFETSSYDQLTNSFVHMFQLTWVSVVVTVAGVASIPLLLMLMFRVVPLLAVSEMQTLGAEEPPSKPAVSSGSASRSAAGAAVILLFVAVGVTGVFSTPPAYAAGDSSQPTMHVTAVENGTVNTLTATVAQAGEPVVGAVVDFYESTTMFAPGNNQVPVGSGVTDSSGTAVVTYEAAVTGPRTISATYFPDVLGDPVVATADLDVTQAVARYVPTPPRILSGFGHGLILTLFGTVIAVFVLLSAQIVRVRRAGRPAPE